MLQSLAKRYGLADRLDANNDDVASRFLIACGAHYRKLEKLLQRIATLSRRHPEQNLSLEMLATAYNQVGDNGHLIGNPFLRIPVDFLPGPSRRCRAAFRSLRAVSLSDLAPRRRAKVNKDFCRHPVETSSYVLTVQAVG